MKHFDAAARDRFKLNAETLDGYCHVIDEEIDSLEDGSSSEFSFAKSEINDVDLSSFRPQDELNPKVWVNGRLNSRVRLRLLDIADTFIDTLEVDWVKPVDIILTGSLANYNWSKFSDFDLHVLIDFNEVDERTAFVKDYFDSKKKIWNDTHDNLTIYGFPVELYVQDVNEKHTASGVYSLERDTWVVEPHPDNIQAIKLNKFLIKEKTIKIINEILELEEAFENSSDDEYKCSKIAEKAKKLFDRIKGIRKESLKNGGEMSSGNVIFKCLRRLGYIGRLVDLKVATYDRLNSIK